MRWKPLLAAFAMALVTAAAAAQPKPEESARGRELSRAEKAERLERYRDGMLTKMMSDNIAKKGVERRQQWLRKFQLVESEHYLILTNGPTATCRKFGKTLEELYSWLRQEFDFQDTERLLDCYIFKSREEYYDFCVKIVGWDEKRARGTAGHATGRYYATYYTSPRAPVVYHEASHQIVSACMRVTGVGSWFQEGMAVYIEKKFPGMNPSAGVRNDLKSGNYIPLEKFVGLRSLLFESNGHGSRSYRHAGGLIDFLIHTKQEGMQGKFPEFLRVCRAQRGRGKRVATVVFRDVYGMTLLEVEDAWKRYYGIRVPARR